MSTRLNIRKVALICFFLLGIAPVAALAQEYTLQLAVQNGQYAKAGSISPLGSTTRTSGEQVTLTAQAQDGYALRWSCPEAPAIHGSAAESVSLVMDGNYTVTLIFEPGYYSFALQPAFQGGTAVILDPVPANLNHIIVGTTVSAKAIPAPDYSFSRWDVAPADEQLFPFPSSPTVSVYLKRNVTLTPVFTKTTYLLSLATEPAGLGGTVTGGGFYSSGGQAAIVATPGAGFVFEKWMVNSGNVTITNTTGASTTAQFGASPGPWSVTAVFKTADPAAATLAVTTDAGGRVVPTPDGSIVTSSSGALITVTSGASVSLVATSLDPNKYEFIRWTGPVNRPMLSETSVAVNAATAVHANFALMHYNLTVKVAAADGATEIGASKLEASVGGVVASTAPSGTATQYFPVDSPVALTATPGSAEYAFKQWKSTGLSPADTALLNAQGALASTVTANITMPPKSATVTAVFLKIPKSFTLTLGTDGNGGASASGTFTNPLTNVTSSPVITAPGSAAYQEGTTVTLAATAAPNFAFTQWTGGNVANPSSATTTVLMDAAKSVSATFSRTHSNLVIHIAPEAGAGTVVDHATNAAPESRYPANETASLRPQAAPGWAFDHWEVDGVSSGVAVPLAILMSADHTVKAVFTRTYHLAVNVNPAGMGVASGAGDYPGGATANIDVAPASGWIFSNWTVDAGSVNPSATTRAASVTMSQDKTAMANLVQGKRVAITSRSETANTFAPSAADAAAIRASGAFFVGATELSGICHPAAVSGTSSAYVVPNAGITLNTPPATASVESPKWLFVRWENQAAPGIALGGGVSVADDLTLCAVYTDARTLTVNVRLDGAPTSAIGITVDGAAKHDGDTVAATHGATLALDATPPAGYVFAGWTGAEGGAISNLTLSDSRTIVAHFKTRKTLTLGLVTDPAGGEGALSAPALLTARNNTANAALAITSNPTSFAIGQGDSITVTAQASATAGLITYTFAGWDTNGNGQLDNGEPTSASHTASLNADAAFQAIYKRNYELLINVSPIGYGTVTPPIGGHLYPAGSDAAISASPNFGYVFDKWTTTTGAVFTGGTDTPANSVTMSSDHGIVAHFKREANALTAFVKVNGSTPAPVPSALAITVTGGANGTAVLSSGQSETYNYGDHAGLAAATPPGYRFDSWECPLGVIQTSPASNPATLEILGAQQVTACYTSLHTVKLATETLPAEASPGGAPAATGHTSTDGGGYVYAYGDTVSLQAAPYPGYRFLRWEIDLDGDGAPDAGATAENHSFALSSAALAFHPGVITAKAVYAKEYKLTLAINDPAAGSTSPAVGSETVCHHGETVALSATPATGWSFDTWTATGGSALANPTSASGASITINGDTTVTANLSKDAVTLTARILLDGAPPAPANPALTITASGVALVDGGTAAFLYGDSVSLTPGTGIAGFVFTGWSGALTGADNPAALTMNGSKTVTANYSTIRKLTLSTETRPGTETNGGTAAAAGSYQSDGDDYFYKHGDTATLTATPSGGFAFLGWSIDGSATLVPVNTISMSADHTAKAVFAKQYTLTLEASPAGGGTAATSPASGITSTRHYGEVVNLAATANAGFSFSTWASSDSAASPIAGIQSDGMAKITIGGNITATALFSAGAQNLTINITVDGQLMPSTFTALSVNADSTLCYSQQHHASHTGATVGVTASNAIGYKFTGWAGGVTAGSPANTGTVTMGATGKTITASYVSLHTVTLGKVVLPGGEGGSVTVAPGYESNAGSHYVYVHGASASITAAPAPGFVFVGWDVDNDGIANTTGGALTYTFQVNADASINAVFARTYEITFATDPTDGSGGSITPARGTTQTYHHGQVVPLGATPNADWGYHFQGWTATGGSTFDDAGSTSASLTVLGGGIVTGHFSLTGAERDLTILIKVDGALVPVTHPLTVLAGDSTVSGHDAPAALHSTETKKYYPIDTAALDATATGAPALEYAFFAWEDLAVPAAGNPLRSVPMSAGSKTLTALYKSRITLYMATSPAGVGITTPGVGAHTDVLRGDSVAITADLSGSDIDHFVFRNWTVDTGSPAVSPGASITSVLMDPVGNAKTVTANFDPGHRLDVIAKYETSATPGTSPKTYAEAAGSRTTLAKGAGNIAGIHNSVINILDHSVETIVQNGSATVRAVPAVGYTFVGWELDGSIISTATDYTHTMSAPATLKAVFDKIRVTLEVYTQPNTADFVGQCTNGILQSAAGAEPKVYQFFYGATAALHAENHDTDHYYFAGWRLGVGMSPTVISSNLDCTYSPLTQPVTRVTALFLPKSGDYLLRIYTSPDEQNHPGDTYPLITAVSASGYAGTYTVDETGRPVYIVAVPSGTINIHADSSSGGWGFHHWEPISRCAAADFGNRNNNDTTFTHSEPQGLNPLPEVSILAVYANIPGYWLTLRGVFDDVIAYPGLMANHIPGRIAGNTTDSGIPWLYIAGSRLIDAHIFHAGHSETFSPDAAFLASPVSIVGWDYDIGGARVTTGATGNTFTTNPSTAGVSEVVTVHLALDWKTVSIHPTQFTQPSGPGWTVPSSGFNASGAFQVSSGNIYDAHFSYRIINPAPAPFVWQGKRVRESTSPILSVTNGDPASYRFLGWTTTFGSASTQTLGWSANWPQLLQQDREATPVFVRLMPVTLAIVPAGGQMSADKAVIEIPAGDPNNHGIQVTASESIPVPPVQKYDYQRQITVVATPQASEYHVVKEIIIERDIDNDGIYDDSAKTIVPGDNSTAVKTTAFSLDYPTKVTVVFEAQQSQITVNVADSIDGAPHGKIQLNGLPAGGALSQSGTFGYGSIQSVLAIPDAGYTFLGWTVSPASLANAAPAGQSAATVQVDFPKTVSAHFGRNVTLVMATDPDSLPAATITPAAGVYTELPAGTRLTDGSQVSIIAGTDSGWDFMHWEIVDDDHPAAAPRQINSPSSTLTLHGDTKATARYAKLHDVTIEAAPSPFAEESRVAVTQAPVSGGPMTAVANGVATRTGKYRENTALTITAAPGQHFDFSHWEITVDGVAQPNVSTPALAIPALAGDTVVRGVFTPKNYTITVTPYSSDPRTPIASALNGSSTATGVIPPTHDFLNGGATWTLPYGTTFTLSTAAADYYQFARWSDAGTSQTLGADADNCTLTVGGNRAIRAEFTRNQYLLTTTIDPDGSGTIDSAPARGGNPSIHNAGDTLTLTAAYNTNTDFDGWTGNIGTANAASPELPLTMNQDRSVTAHFVDIVRLKIVNPNPAYGSVAVSGHRRTETDGSGNTLYVFKVGAQAVITATPATAHHQFDNWTFDPATPAGVSNSALNTQTFTMTTTPDLVTATANFSPRPYDLTVNYVCADPAPYPSAPVVSALTGSGAFPGSPHDFLATQTKAIRYGAAVTLDAAIAPYYKFDRWTDATGAPDYGSNTSLTFNMPGADTTRIAKIVRGVWKLTAHIAPSGGGSIGYSLAGAADPLATPDTTVYNATNPALTVTLTAQDAPGSIFTSWSGPDAAGALGRALTLTMSNDREVIASFATAYTLTIPNDALGAVTVEGASPYATVVTNGDGSKTYTFVAGSNATVTATPDSPHYEFTAWTFTPITPAGVTPDSLTNAGISFMMDGSYTLTPAYAPKKYDITARPYSADPAPYDGAPIASTLAASGAFPESVFDFLGGIDTVAIAYNTSVSLSQNPAPYYAFWRWTDTTHTATYGSPFTVGVSDNVTNRTLIAQYVRSLYRLRAHVSPSGGGSISASPAGSPDPQGQPKTTVYAPNTVVTLTANDAAGKIFTHWSGDAIAPSGRNLTITMDNDRDVTANFANAWKLTIPAGIENGDVSVSGYSPYSTVITNGDGSKTYTFAEGATATVTATPASQHYFVNRWDFTPDISAGVTPNPVPAPGAEAPKTISFTMTQDVTVAPHFQPKTYTLTVTPVPAAGAQTLVATIGGILDHDFLLDSPSLKHLYPTQVQLSTTPKDVSGAHYRFDSWKEGFTVLGTGTGMTFTYDKDADITANYIRQVVVTINPAVDVTPANSCPPAPFGTVDPAPGTYRYDVTSTPATKVITAVAATGFEFAGWGTSALPSSVIVSETTTADISVATLTLTIDDTLADAGDIVITPQFRRRIYNIVVERWEKGLGVPNAGGLIGGDGSGQYFYGAVLRPYVSAAYTGYRFVGWGWGANTTASRAVQQPASGSFPDSFAHSVTGDATISAVFTRVCILKVDTDPADGSKGTASITSPAGLFVGGTPPGYQFDYGTQVNLEALAKPGSSFASWAGAVNNPDAADTFIVMKSDQTVIARFITTVYNTLTISASPPLGGSVQMNSDPSDAAGYGTGHPVSYSKTFTGSPTVQLTATPAPGFAFSGWTGPVTINNPAVLSTSVVLDTNKTVTAKFTPRSYTLQVYASPSAGGSVSSGGTYAYNGDGTPRNVPLIATANSGWQFVRWEATGGAVANATSPSTTVSMSADTIAYAIFRSNEETFPPKVLVYEVTDMSTKVLNPMAATISAIEGPDEYGDYKIVAHPAPGYAISGNGWSGDVSTRDNSGAPATYTALASGLDHQREVHFLVARKMVLLQWSALPGDAGTVVLAPAGDTPANLATTGGLFPVGATVSVTASGVGSYTFKEWFGALSGTSPTTTIYMDDDKVIGAFFSAKVPDWRVTLGFDSLSICHPSGEDKVTLDGVTVARGDAPPLITKYFPDKSTVLFHCTVKDPANYRFDGWTNIQERYRQPAGVGQWELYVETNLDPRALIRTVNPLLQTRVQLTDPTLEFDPSIKIDIKSVGGDITPGGIMNLGDVVTIRVTINPGFAMDHWEPPDGASTISSSSVTGTDPDTGLRWEERQVTLKDLQTLVVVYLKKGDGGTGSGVNRRDRIKGGKDMHDDITTNRSSGHFIDDKNK